MQSCSSARSAGERFRARRSRSAATPRCCPEAPLFFDAGLRTGVRNRAHLSPNRMKFQIKILWPALEPDGADRRPIGIRGHVVSARTSGQELSSIGASAPLPPPRRLARPAWTVPVWAGRTILGALSVVQPALRDAAIHERQLGV